MQSLFVHHGFLMCAACAAIVLPYYRACATATCTGRIHPARNDDVTLCDKCYVPPPSDWPCTGVDCNNRVDAKWKTTCTSCYIKNLPKDPESATPFSGACTTARCNGKVDAKWKKRCGRCYARGLR